MTQTTGTPSAYQEELFPVETIIRTETLFTRHPIHQLSNSATLPIDIQGKTESGKSTLWSVSYNEEFGPPRQLAYQIDTLVINRRIDEAPRPLPEVLKVASSLREICRQLGRSEKDTEHVKRALFQNASAFVLAKQTYRSVSGQESDLTFGGTRYSIVLAGEQFPTGTKADGVYVVLNKAYRDALNGIPRRPLDYDYLRFLPASSQRLYELLSFHIFGAIHHGRPCARYLYSQFCTFAPLVRNHSWDEVKKQLYKVHLPHLKAGYIERVEHEALVDDTGQADWALFYTPGKKAYAEYAAFTGERKRRPRSLRGGEGSNPVSKPALEPPAQQLLLPGVDAALVEELVASELNRADAERLAVDKTQECRRQLEYLPFVKEFRTSKGAYLRRAIEQGWGPPPAYAEHLEQEEKRQRQARQQETQSTRKAAEDARRATILSGGLRWVERLEKEAPEAFSGFVEEEARGRGAYIKGLSGSLAREAMLTYYDSPEQRLLRLVDHFSRHPCPVPDLAAWLQEHPVKKLKSLLSS